MFGIVFCFVFGVLCFVGSTTCFSRATKERFRTDILTSQEDRRARVRNLRFLGFCSGVVAIALFAAATFIGSPVELGNQTLIGEDGTTITVPR